MKAFIEYWPVLIPVVAIELILMVTALLHVLRHDHFKHGNKTVWIITVVLLQIIGPVAYFIFGREDE